MTITIRTLTILPSQGFELFGESSGDYAGFSVSGGGDINGDGIADVIVGAPGAPSGTDNAGRVYVVFGRTDAPAAPRNLGALGPSDGFIIQGDADRDFAGGSVASVGDVNGDGIDDLLIGAYSNDRGGTSVGEAYVIYGKRGTDRSLIDISTLAASDGFVIRGDTAFDTAGRSVAGAGDINGDGIRDLIVGAPNGDDGGANAGEAYVIYGQAGATRTLVDLTGLAAADGFVIQGDAVGDRLGQSVAGAGDVNGDGVGDVIVGAYRGDDGGIDAGEAYVIYGQTGSTRGRLDVASLAAADGFIIVGSAADDQTGRSVAGAGDVNNDGIDDIIVGAPFSDANGNASGQAHVIYGTPGNSRGTVLTANLVANDGFTIVGREADNTAGISVAAAGDVNDDGIADVIIGTLSNTGTAGAYVIFGISTARGSLALASFATADGFYVSSIPSDRLGGSVSTAGDVNSDGIDDIIVGADATDRGAISSGSAFVVYGARAPFTVGNDVVVNAPGNQAYNGGGGFDQLDMGAFTGAITLDTALGTVVSAEGGNDTVTNVEFFTLGSGDDSVTLGNGGFVVRAGFGNDQVTGGTGRDLISGGDGNDTLAGGTGAANELGGGAGDDVYIVSAAGDSVIEAANGGTDEIRTTLAVFTNKANVETLRFTDNATHVGVGTSQNETIIGGTGRDDLFGRGGNDTLIGGAGVANTLIGGAGDDIYVIEAIGDSIIETAGEGTDTVRTALNSFTMRDNVEILEFTGTGNLTAIGSATANTLTGKDGADFLSGLDGDDVLTGGLGLDLLIGGAGADTFRINNAADRDRILDFVSGTDRIALDGAVFTRTATIDYVAGSVATSTNSTFLYVSANGTLSYDADGTGAGAAVAIANLGGGLTLNVGDFLIY